MGLRVGCSWGQRLHNGMQQCTHLLVLCCGMTVARIGVHVQGQYQDGHAGTVQLMEQRQPSEVMDSWGNQVGSARSCHLNMSMIALLPLMQHGDFV